MKTKRISLQKMIFCGLLVAIQIILSRFMSINAWNTKIGFGFVPIFLAGYLYGPILGGIVGALGDFVGAILFPIGPYFPGFTLTTFLSGVIFGLFFFKNYKERKVMKITLTVIIDQLILSLLINTLWISMLYGSKFNGILISRIPQVLIMCVVEPVIILGILKFFKKEKFISSKDGKNMK